MRRKDKEITDRGEIEAIILQSDVCRLAMADAAGPYIVPLNFGFSENSLYFHSAHKGRKMDIIKKNPQVCFEFDLGVRIISGEKACNWGTYFKSVIGFGKAQLVNDTEAKKKALNIIMDHYAGKSFQFSETDVDRVAIIRVDINQMTGKHAQAQG
jgi:nitroimidazol reductase NimA-like FMN-containing flavoprotein (pyridoxamine 5'-phosphate oxidase superfamily)